MSPSRNGNFTSSEIVALLSMGSRPMTPDELAAHKAQFPKSQKKNCECWPGDAAMTYINEKNMERRLGRPLTDDTNARPLSWGKLLERHVFDILGTEYRLCSQDTIDHPTIPCWKGSPDAEKFDEGKTVVDIKCPITLKSFCQLVDGLYQGLEGRHALDWMVQSHKDGEKYYIQVVSNAILTGAKYGELVVYMPYLSELQDIRDRAAMWDGDKQYRLKWINDASDDELPHLIDGGYYKNVNVIRWEIAESDKTLLTSRVLEAQKLLEEYHHQPEPIYLI